ncbi:MAG TPA: nucleoside triphosphate pyrophosphohydrolase [Amaricoccus sp.]|nr:nucleoside triphosphate pyrophosphohydrolase [Amaricoccus sp.]
MPDDAAAERLIHDREAGLQRLVAIMARLRDPDGGCPWDLEQTFDSIAPYTIEEAYEVADAIARRSMPELRDELGDLLLQVVYHARMAEESGAFRIGDVIRGVSDKMLRRHPHVFGDESRDKSADEQTRDWERMKADERAARPGTSGALAGVATGLPALTRAVKLQDRAARVGFDWPDAGAVLDKIVEEANELAEARAARDPAGLAEEYGDLMFVMANLARHLRIDPEAALRGANAKFTRRFAAIEAALAAEGRTPSDSTLAEMDALWDAAKRAEK